MMDMQTCSFEELLTSFAVILVTDGQVSNCPICHQMNEVLDRHDIAMDSWLMVNLSEMNSLKAQCEQYSLAQGYPQLYINAFLVGVGEELLALEEEGDLSRLLRFE